MAQATQTEDARGTNGGPEDEDQETEERQRVGEPLAERRRSIRQAKLHFAIVAAAAMVVAAGLLALGIPYEAGVWDEMPVPARWTALFLVAVLGALTKRGHAIGYYGFKVQEYEPITWRYHLAVGWRASLVAMAFVALGEKAAPPVTIGEDLPLLMAFGFGAGYFGEATFEVFEERFRALIGNEASPRRPVRKALTGIDLPIAELDDDVLADLEALADGTTPARLVRDLQEAGFDSSREVIGAYLTSSGREALEEAVPGRSEDEAEAIAAVCNLLRVGASLEDAVSLVNRGITEPEDVPHPSSLPEVGMDEEGFQRIQKLR